MPSQPDYEKPVLQPMFIQNTLARLNGKSRRLIVVVAILFVLAFLAPTARRLDYWPHSSRDAFNDKAFDVNEIADEKARIGKVCILYGDENPVYERALGTHKLHNRLHGYPMFIQRENILDGYWTKPAHVLSVVLHELSKPASQRLLWLWWFDADTIILNYLTPLEAFLPPTSSVAAGSKEAAEELKKVNIITTDDWNGLNNGIFAIRVSPYAVEMLSGVLAYRDLRADESLSFSDQSAMENMINMRKFQRYAAKVPARWFNTYTYDDDDKSGNRKTHDVRPGDLLVHFAGVGDRAKPMSDWIARSERRSTVWNVPPEKASYRTDVARYWTQYAADKRRMRETWTDARDQLRGFNKTALATLAAADRAAADGGVPPDAIQTFSNVRVEAEKLLLETDEFKPEDLIPQDVDDMVTVLSHFERASTTLIGFVGEKAEELAPKTETAVEIVAGAEEEKKLREAQEKEQQQQHENGEFAVPEQMK